MFLRIYDTTYDGFFIYGLYFYYKKLIANIYTNVYKTYCLFFSIE